MKGMIERNKGKPEEWKINFERLRRIIEKSPLTLEEAELLVDLYQSYLYSWMKGYDVQLLGKMYYKAEELKKSLKEIQSKQFILSPDSK